MRYRIDFSRLSRSFEELALDLQVAEVLQNLCKAFKIEPQKFDYLPEGHQLDSIIVDDEPNLTGKEILEKHVKNKYPEATLCSWDCWEECFEEQTS